MSSLTTRDQNCSFSPKNLMVDAIFLNLEYVSGAQSLVAKNSKNKMLYGHSIKVYCLETCLLQPLRNAPLWGGWTPWGPGRHLWDRLFLLYLWFAGEIRQNEQEWWALHKRWLCLLIFFFPHLSLCIIHTHTHTHPITNNAVRLIQGY